MAETAAGPDQFTGATPDNALRNAERADGPMLAADGTPLKASLARSLRRQKIRAFLLVLPLLVFVLVTFIAPIVDMLWRSVENDIVSETLPRTVVALDGWEGEDLPGEEVFVALARDMNVAVERKNHTRLGTRLNYETTGMSSLFRRSGRGMDEIGEPTMEQFIALDAAWEEPATWVALMADPDWIERQAEWAAAEDRGAEPRFRLNGAVEAALPQTADIYGAFARTAQVEDEDSPTEEEPWPVVYQALASDLAALEALPEDLPADTARLLSQARDAIAGFTPEDVRAAFLDLNEDWGDLEVWGTIEAFSDPLTAGYFLAAADLQLTPQGIERQPEDQRIYGTLFLRTLWMSLLITGSCILLGYPVAWLLANLPMRTANVLMILVLLPFWTSLLVRTSAWKVLLQQQGVINDILVWSGLLSDGNRLVMINNATGTIIAMTHILLPFMILPLYSVMKTIDPSYLRAAKSLGATNTTAFWRVYFPLSVPGIGAGSILVFILAIGYYITPELVGGTKGVFISNRIAFHISSSLNWGLAAALGTILLAVVLLLYWLYDRLVGIDNVKLGG
ncbi:ABC transporter permease [Aestuariibius sp. 2305UL40-4]|uniref:ABC transporter permease n=1 Tax=Aestuariibius violaceus TaxID=3234132 RepID=UPI00345EEB80